MREKEENIWRSRLAFLTAGVLVIVTLCVFGVIDALAKNVTVSDDGVEISFVTYRGTVKGALAAKGIIVDEKDVVSPDIYASLCENNSIMISRGKTILLRDGENESVEFVSTKKNVMDFLNEQAITLGEYDVLSVTPDAVISDGLEIAITRNAATEVIEQVALDFEIETRSNANLPTGQTKTVREGVPGLREDLYKVMYSNGVPTEKELISQNIVQKPVSAIVERGTQVAATRPEGEVQIASRGGFRYRDCIEMNATAYDPSVGNRTATGITPYKGVVAVDPKVIPLGTKLYIESTDGSYVYGYAVAADTGGAIKGKKIDLFMESRTEALQFGRRTVRVYILEN